MSISAVEILHGDVAVELRDVKFKRVLFLEKETKPMIKLHLNQIFVAETNRHEYAVRLDSFSGAETWIEHVSMTVCVFSRPAHPQMLDVEKVKSRCSEMRACGDTFYDSLGIAYSGDFKSLQTVWRGVGESLGLIELKSDEDRPATLLRCALLDCATHVGIEQLERGSRAGDMYAASIETYYVPCAHQEHVEIAWSHLTTDGESHESCLSVYTKDGRLLARFTGVETGLRNTSLVQHEGSLVSFDDWVCRSSVPVLDEKVEMIRPKDVLELHSVVLSRMDRQAPLCVVARDEELAAYVRAVRAECRGWALRCVVTADEAAGTPVEIEEGEWKLSSGIWSVRRLSKALAPHPLAAGFHASKNEDHLFDATGTYVVSGGLGYIGRLVAKAMIEHGARRIVLLSSSRSTLPDDWNLDVRPDVIKCDVGERSEVQRVFDRYRDVRGIIHAAGVLADGTLKNLKEDDFKRVYRPKVEGARNLDECTRGLSLDFFVLFSSVASGFGGVGRPTTQRPTASSTLWRRDVQMRGWQG